VAFDIFTDIFVKEDLIDNVLTALGDYADTPNVFLFFGKSTRADKPSLHILTIIEFLYVKNRMPNVSYITGDVKAITGNAGH